MTEPPCAVLATTSESLPPWPFIAGLAGLVVLGIAMAVVYLVATCKVCRRLGHPWSLGLLTFVPFGQWALMVYLGFVDSTAGRRRRRK